jgi:hypothetical protein
MMTIILNNKKILYAILGIILFPLLVLLFEMFVTIFLRIGQFIGTYLRVLYEVC